MWSGQRRFCKVFTAHMSDRCGLCEISKKLQGPLTLQLPKCVSDIHRCRLRPSSPTVSSTALVFTLRSQYSTHPSRSIFFKTVLNPWLLFESPSSAQNLFTTSPLNPAVTIEPSPAPSGYSIWKTGLPALMKDWKVLHSLYLTHCSLTEKCTTPRTAGIMVPAFLSPRIRFKGTVIDER